MSHAPPRVRPRRPRAALQRCVCALLTSAVMLVGGGAAAAPPPEAAAVFALSPGNVDDPYGPRAEGTVRLPLAQVLTYALENPLIEAAQAEVDARSADLQRARFAWIPAIKTSLWLSPGANIRCDDVALVQQGSAEAFDFQYCRPGGDEDLDIQTIRGYLAQLQDAGIFLRMQAEFVVPIYTFGRLITAKKLAKLGRAVSELERERIRVDTVRKVRLAHASLLLARASLDILDEAWRFLQTERTRLEAGLNPGFDAEPDEIADDLDPADLFELEIGELELATRAREARRIEADALASLWALAGDAAPIGFDVDERDVAPLKIDGGLRNTAHYQRLAMQHRPEAKLAQAGVEARRLQEKQARSAFLPNIGFAVKATYGYGNRSEQVPALYYSKRLNYGAINLGLAMNWDLDLHTKTFGLRKARFRTRAAQLRRDAALAFMQLEVDQARRAVMASAEQAALIDAARAKSWSLVLDQRAKQTIGTADMGKLRTALKQWAEYEFRHLEAITARNTAIVRLSRAVGVGLVAPGGQDGREDRDATGTGPAPLPDALPPAAPEPGAPRDSGQDPAPQDPTSPATPGQAPTQRVPPPE